MSFSKKGAQTYAQEFAKQTLVEEGERLMKQVPDNKRKTQLLPDSTLGHLEMNDLYIAVNLLWRSIPEDGVAQQDKGQ